MTSRKTGDMPHVECIVVDADTLRFGGSDFVREHTCHDISAEYGKFVCGRCGCVIHDTSEIDNGAVNYCPDCRAKVVEP